MKSQEFKTRYLHTLQTDPETNQSYIKLPIADFGELGDMQQSLLDGLIFLSQLEDARYDDGEIRSSMYWLSRILLSMHPQDELEGLSKWLKKEEEQ